MATIKERVDAIVDKTNKVNELLKEIGGITGHQHSLSITTMGKKKKRYHLTVCLDIKELHG